MLRDELKFKWLLEILNSRKETRQLAQKLTQTIVIQKRPTLKVDPDAQPKTRMQMKLKQANEMLGDLSALVDTCGQTIERFKRIGPTKKVPKNSPHTEMRCSPILEPSSPRGELAKTMHFAERLSRNKFVHHFATQESSPQSRLGATRGSLKRVPSQEKLVPVVKSKRAKCLNSVLQTGKRNNFVVMIDQQGHCKKSPTKTESRYKACAARVLEESHLPVLRNSLQTPKSSSKKQMTFKSAEKRDF
jgi:hypothetical protein